jgi:hypothetical protein
MHLHSTRLRFISQHSEGVSLFRLNVRSIFSPPSRKVMAGKFLSHPVPKLLGAPTRSARTRRWATGRRRRRPAPQRVL